MSAKKLSPRHHTTKNSTASNISSTPKLIARSSRSPLVKFSRRQLQRDIIQEAKVLGLHLGAATIIADKVSASVEQWAKKRSSITIDDLTRVTARELKKYHTDLSYVYQNRDKII